MDAGALKSLPELLLLFVKAQVLTRLDRLIGL